MMVNQILVTPLNRINSPGGDVLHAMKHGDNGYAGFGETYFSWVLNGKIKGWKRHTKMTMNLIVPVGQVCFVFFSEGHNEDNEYRVERIGLNRYVRITVPPGIWFAFQGLYEPQSLLVNIANISHDPNEVEQLELSKIQYDWINS
jgi:dTDP-4-dehydrorhamnose 3,5-epimerase